MSDKECETRILIVRCVPPYISVLESIKEIKAAYAFLEVSPHHVQPDNVVPVEWCYSVALDGYPFMIPNAILIGCYEEFDTAMGVYTTIDERLTQPRREYYGSL